MRWHENLLKTAECRDTTPGKIPNYKVCLTHCPTDEFFFPSEENTDNIRQSTLSLMGLP